MKIHEITEGVENNDDQTAYLYESLDSELRELILNQVTAPIENLLNTLAVKLKIGLSKRCIYSLKTLTAIKSSYARCVLL